MRRSILFVLVAAVPCAAAAVQPVVEGDLELVWGDREPGFPGGDRLLAQVRLDDDTRVALDPVQARQAAGDLYALQGHRVAVALATAPRVDGGGASGTFYASSAIVSAEVAEATTAGITGSQPWVTLACKFSDVAAEPKTTAYFDTMLSNAPGRLDDYWRTVSYGAANIIGSGAFGWFTLPHARGYYIPAGGSANLTALFQDCTGVADASVNFAPFIGINLMFNDNLDGYAWGGNRYATLDGRYASWRVTWEPPWGYANEAPLAHEMGHGFGLPHANNSDLDSDPYDNPWDVMSDAWHNAVADATYGTQPKHINVYSRDYLGWIAPARKLTVATAARYELVPLDAAEIAGSGNLQMIVVTSPGEVASKHYYTIEARRAGTAGDLYDGKLAGTAVIIHDVVPGRPEPAWSVDAQMPPANVSNNAGSQFTSGESWSSPNGAIMVSVGAATASGFLVTIDRAADDVIFRSTL